MAPDSILILSLFAVFGTLCGFWLSVVGFAMTVVGLAVICGLMNSLLGEWSGAWFIIYSIIALQVGYFTAIVFRAFAVHISSAPPAGGRDSKEDVPTQISQE